MIWSIGEGGVWYTECFGTRMLGRMTERVPASIWTRKARVRFLGDQENDGSWRISEFSCPKMIDGRCSLSQWGGECLMALAQLNKGWVERVDWVTKLELKKIWK